MAIGHRAWVTLAFAMALPAAAQTRSTGDAYGASDGSLRYRETHWVYRDAAGAARLVLYTCPDGRAFARKVMRFPATDVAPDFDFLDARSGQREGVRPRGAAREAYAQDDRGDTMRTRALSDSRGIVIDAGFDAWIRTHWAAIDRRGRTADFLVPSRLRTYAFRIRHVGDRTERGRAVRVMHMSLDGVLGLATPSIELTYDVRDRRLLRFVGPATVRDARGRTQTLRVEFADAPVTGRAALAGLDAARNVPLVTSC